MMMFAQAGGHIIRALKIMNGVPVIFAPMATSPAACGDKCPQ
jgi:hypothetical protein